MTVPCRPLLLLLAAALAGPATGCIITSDKAVPITPPDWKPPADKPATRVAASGFGVELPAGPGVKVPTNPAAKAAAETASARKPTPEAEPPQPTAFVKAEVAPIPPPQPLPPPFVSVPAAAEPPLLAALRTYVENKPDQALEQLSGLDRANQEYVLAVLPALVRGAALNLAVADPRDVAVLVDQLQTAAGRLEGRAALKIDKLLFCREVRGFGLYDPRPVNKPYPVGSIALLYGEVRHLVAEPAAKGDGFVTQLESTLEIRDANGKLVGQADPTDHRRTVTAARTKKAVASQSMLSDFFVTYRIAVPSTPGVYTVTVEVRSPVGNRVVRSQPVTLLVSAP
jgi:hypothetical protein